MTDQLRVMFDENMGRPLVRALSKLLAFHDPPPVVMHLIDFEHHQGADDRVWIPKLVDDGWVVVSSDRGRKKRYAQLPTICQKLRVTHFLFSGALHNSKQFEKARAVITLWPRIVEAATDARGKRYLMQKGRLHPVLKEKPAPVEQ